RNLSNAKRRSIRGQDRRGTADLIEQSEDLDLRFHLLGHGLDHQVSLTRRFFHARGIFKSPERSIRVRGSDLAEFDGFVQISADLCLSPAQRVGQNVFQDRAIAAARRSMGDSTSHDARADDGNRLDLRHYWPPFSSNSRTATKLGSDFRI